MVYGLIALSWRKVLHPIELRQNGLILGKFKFVPWSEVRILDWNAESGSIVISLYGASLTMFVPPQFVEATASLELIP